MNIVVSCIMFVIKATLTYKDAPRLLRPLMTNKAAIRMWRY